ncbi:LacI family DNA-binding transcriptional regulator [Nakamurella sp. PAMC28650]|uniref:LacI family DNA-binding transcriptional regulator n=1 Tax=Nakamurella sp. PAMC28650 TaxID=2762325 RepID=UPI00164D9658|nr:LacI family DNA-binding transcriptional regulator [Nakamurella sp. PAMC28650]QNK82192.1 LacI family DNA-binding transcriptional regulator [Nakamurella sp. PAMC28650]
MAVTLRDVALRAGVSVRTVSNVVNGFRHVSPQMRELVQAAIDELGYQPNVLARSLRRGHTGVIALLVPELGVPYFGELAHQVIEAARVRGLTVMVDETAGNAAREREILDLATSSGLVDGVILSALGLSGDEVALLHPRVPMVLLGEHTAPRRFDHAGTDNVLAAKDAVAHLVAAGARRVAVIGAEPGAGRETSRLRLRGYRAAVKAAGQRPDPGLVQAVGTFHRQDGAEAMHRLLGLANPPDATFCFNDSLALGALRVLYDRGIRSPQDMRIVGFDDVEEGRFSMPTLSTIAPDKPAIARAAVDLLCDRIGGSTLAPRDVVVPHHLVLRESSQVGAGVGPDAVPGSTG